MKKPLSRVLIINDEPLVLKEFVKGLNAAARSLDNPLGITFTGVTTARDALAAIEDGDLQAVVVDDKLYTLNQKSAKKEMSALELEAGHALPSRARRLHPDRAGARGR